MRLIITFALATLAEVACASSLHVHLSNAGAAALEVRGCGGELCSREYTVQTYHTPTE